MMKKTRVKQAIPDDSMRPEYDFSHGVRGKYAGRFPKDCIMIVLDPDVAEVFPTAKRANDALRAIAGIVKRSKKSA
jgi:hypothetical protein